VNDPRYQQIADELRQMIESGEARPGSMLPTETELRRRYDASRNTVRDAIKKLVTQGLVETHAGRGTFVREAVKPIVTILGRGPGVGGETFSYRSELESQQHTAVNIGLQVEVQTAESAPELGLGSTFKVISRHQKRLIDGRPWSLQTTFYPWKLYDDGAKRLLDAQNIEPGAVQYLHGALGVTEVGWSDFITVRRPDRPEAEFFGVADDGRVPVIEVRRTGFKRSGDPLRLDPLRLTVTIYAADRNKFRIDVGQVPEGSRDGAAANEAPENGARHATIPRPSG
jgi:GntR family transcriptional regulator